MIVRLTHIDGRLPNIALMRLAHWHRARGDEVVFRRSLSPELDEPRYDRVYASSIFKTSADKIATVRNAWPTALIGGTGTDSLDRLEHIAPGIGDDLDYSIYPDYRWSIGFSSRGCRLTCGFCVVPSKEGRIQSSLPIQALWRGRGHPKAIHLLDNDFFGDPAWERKIDEITEEGFRVCFNQGINIRLINPRIAAALARIKYRDDDFRRARLYTAWDSLGDEAKIMRGFDYLADAGIPGKHVMVYMLIGWDPAETWTAIFRRFDALVARGAMPYPMPWHPGPAASAEQLADYRRLKQFQRWAVLGMYRMNPPIAWSDYDPNAKGRSTSKVSVATSLSLFH